MCPPPLERSCTTSKLSKFFYRTAWSFNTKPTFRGSWVTAWRVQRTPPGVSQTPSAPQHEHPAWSSPETAWGSRAGYEAWRSCPSCYPMRVSVQWDNTRSRVQRAEGAHPVCQGSNVERRVNDPVNWWATQGWPAVLHLEGCVTGRAFCTWRSHNTTACFKLSYSQTGLAWTGFKRGAPRLRSTSPARAAQRQVPRTILHPAPPSPQVG